MPGTQPSDGGPCDSQVSSGVRAAYDAVARAYDSELADELDGKPLDRALLAGFVELVGEGTIADVGCGPGHVTRYLAARHPDVIGIDLSPGMIAVARERAHELSFAEGSMLQLPAANGAWAGMVAMYSIIHLTADERATACREFARALRSGGWALVMFHIDSAEFRTGEFRHITDWFGESVDINAHFIDPAEVVRDLVSAGFAIRAELERQPLLEFEYPTRRCYLLAQRT